MKAHITITDDNGTVFEGDAELAQVSGTRKTRSQSPKSKVRKEPVQKLDFTKPERAFIKSYASKLSGAKKFVMLLAFMSKGVANKEVRLKDIEKHWNKMTALLGKFNRFHANSAKESGWVNTQKQGLYVLCSSWKEVLKEKNG